MEHSVLEEILAPPSLSWGAVTDKGKEREENEDSFLIHPEERLFLVSDGMGGHRGGALASKIVTEDLPVMIETRLHKSKSTSPRTIRSIFKKSIIEQSKHLRMEGDSESGYREMGATLVLAMFRNSRAYICNLGDSRIYRLRNGSFKQLTKDHSVISELIEKGRIEPEEAEGHEAEGQITHYVGMEEDAKPHIKTFKLKRKDRLLLCTDGLTDMLSDDKIAEVLRSENDPQKACRTLIRKANAAGGHDNITTVIIDYMNPESPSPLEKKQAAEAQ